MRIKPRFKPVHSLAALLLALTSAPSQAHFFSEAHDCKAPEKPLEFITELDREQFEQKVTAYRDCLQSFVDKQNAAMEKHRSAGQRAADTWERYQQQVLGISTAQESAEPPANQ